MAERMKCKVRLGVRRLRLIARRAKWTLTDARNGQEGLQVGRSNKVDFGRLRLCGNFHVLILTELLRRRRRRKCASLFHTSESEL